MPLKTFIFTSFAFLAVVSSLSVSAQIQQAWVAHYNNGITNGTHQAVKMALDSAGNIYITGFSQNTNGNLDYVTIKYAPNGNQLWAARFDSTNTATAKPAALALDPSKGVIITGSALTIKYDSNGNQVWTAPYAGTALALDPAGDAYVTGFGTNFNTVKLDPTGSNLWVSTFSESAGPTISQAVLVDSAGNVYVSGLDTFVYARGASGRFQGFVALTTIKYDPDGNQVWKATTQGGDFNATSLKVEGVALDSENNCCVAAQFYPQVNQYSVYKISSNGAAIWSAVNPDASCGSDLVHGLAIDRTGEVFVTGQTCYFAPNDAYATFEYGTYKANTNGSWIWTNTFPPVPVQPSVATSIAVDNVNNVYVTGYSFGTNSGNDIVTIKYDNNGNQIWLERYNGPANGDDEGNAIAVDTNGNVYVTGYATVAGGGTEMVTIKYAPGPLLQKQSNGSILLQAVGAAGQNFDIQASTNLQTWQDLGTNTADTNGMLQYTDTNAPLFDRRFYLTIPQ